jgi:16S rRNA (adenine1518-N6/adenine1519-N6)-dimethyltransferase
MKSRLGQHFLADEAAARQIVAAAELDGSGAVLEIGPGKGVLTGIIAEGAGDVAAVELDEGLCALLEKKFMRRGNIRIIRGSILDADLGRIFPGRSGKVKVIGNIPYYITSPILEKLFLWREGIELAVLTMQKEVAERMCSGPGSKTYGALSVFAASNCRAGIIARISRESFSPPPEVDSAVVRIAMREKPVVCPSEAVFFSRFVKSMFAQKRKMVHNALQRAARLEKDGAARLLAEAGVDGTLRPERLSVGQYALLFKKVMESK